MKRKMYFILLASVVIGFAAVSAELIFSGTAKIGANLQDYDIFFSNVWIDEEEHRDYISDDGKSIDFHTDILKNIGETAEIKYEITNASKQYDSNIVINCLDTNDNEYIKVQESNDFNNFIVARHKGLGTITITLKKSIVDEKEINIKCVINTNAEEKSILDDTYIEDDYTSEEIEFNMSNNEEILTVKDALDDLYNIYLQ